MAFSQERSLERGARIPYVERPTHTWLPTPAAKLAQGPAPLKVDGAPLLEQIHSMLSSFRWRSTPHVGCATIAY
jgi:hypothetical protein